MRSMTGYGRGEGRNDRYHLTVELRSVNHRYLEPVIRLPRELMALEEMVRQKIQEKIYRGRVEVFINQETGSRLPQKVVVDEDMATDYVRALRRLEETFATEPGGLTAEKLALFPDVLVLEQDKPDQELVTPLLTAALTGALGELQNRREREGERLAADIAKRVQRLNVICAGLKRKSTLVPEQYRQKLTARLEKLYNGQEYDKQRFFLEVALFAEKCDIGEEIVRLESHLQAFEAEMERSGSIGRKLDFLLQEMHREANTIAAKGNDLEISHFIVEAKSEIEKIREQVQNIE